MIYDLCRNFGWWCENNKQGLRNCVQDACTEYHRPEDRRRIFSLQTLDLFWWHPEDRIHGRKKAQNGNITGPGPSASHQGRSVNQSEKGAENLPVNYLKSSEDAIGGKMPAVTDKLTETHKQNRMDWCLENQAYLQVIWSILKKL